MVGGIIGRTVSYDGNNTGNLNLTNIYSVGNIASFDLNQENKTFKLNNKLRNYLYLLLYNFIIKYN